MEDLTGHLELNDVFLRNTTSNNETQNETSIYTAFIFIILGLAAFLIALFSKKKKKLSVMQCNIKVKSCYVTYGSTNLILPKLTDTFQKSIHAEEEKKSKISFPKYKFPVRKSKIVSVSDLWKAKSRQSNNYFVINIIPEEEEFREEKN